MFDVVSLDTSLEEIFSVISILKFITLKNSYTISNISQVFRIISCEMINLIFINNAYWAYIIMYTLIT